MDARQLRTAYLGRDRGALGSAAIVQERATHGGAQLRRRIKELLRESDARPEPELLAFQGTTTIDARGSVLSVQLDAYGRSWAMASYLLERYDMPFAWDESHRWVHIGAMDVRPILREDGVQVEVGWPLFEMSLQSGSAPVILRRVGGPQPMGIGPDVEWWNLPRNSASP